jgi:intracellular sulfur oxidation DsrE/DsrF family protein
MKQGITVLVVAGLLAVVGYLLLLPLTETGNRDDSPTVNVRVLSDVPEAAPDTRPARVVLDISVHTEQELEVLLDRAEQLAMKPRADDEGAGIVLVLHGPEVEFFSNRNYDRYRDIVDQAARLDALEIVDVKICQSMMEVQGVAREDIPPFIEQVPYGPAEIESLVRQGYVYF